LGAKLTINFVDWGLNPNIYLTFITWLLMLYFTIDNEQGHEFNLAFVRQHIFSGEEIKLV